MTVLLRYERRLLFLPGDNRRWTIRSTFIDANGFDRKSSTFNLQDLINFGIVPQIGKVKSQPEAA